METERAVPLWRNPFVLAFVVGCVMVTLIRPFLRFEPRPPPVLSKLPAFSLVDKAARPSAVPSSTGRLGRELLLHQVPVGLPLLMSRMAKLQDRFEREHVDGVRLVSITVDPVNDTPERLRAAHPATASIRRAGRCSRAPLDRVLSSACRDSTYRASTAPA